METATRDQLTVLHGMGFGALFVSAFSGALVELYRISTPGVPDSYLAYSFPSFTTSFSTSLSLPLLPKSQVEP